MIKTKYLIIGNSIAGVNCIEAIREIDKTGKIVVISEEGILNYSRPLISYYLGGKVNKEKMSFREEGFYKENKVKVLLNTKADKLDVKKKEIHFNHQKVKFDKLLIATGGKPIVPPIENLEKIKEGIFTFTNFSSTQKLIDYLEKNKIKEAIVLGAGLIGLKCTEGLVERRINVTIVELADKILANTFDKESSGILENALSKLGCKVIKEDTIVKVEGKEKLTKVILRSGRQIPTQLLIIAVGVRPNLDLIKDTPISFERGIIVDDICRLI
jgi:NAD(P)H-nitrite reductase large subunit